MVEREPWGIPQSDSLRSVTGRNRMNEISGLCIAGCMWRIKQCTWQEGKPACVFLTSVCGTDSGMGWKSSIGIAITHTVHLPPTNKENRTPSALGANGRAIKTNTLCANCLWVICQTERSLEGTSGSRVKWQWRKAQLGPNEPGTWEQGWFK